MTQGEDAHHVEKLVKKAANHLGRRIETRRDRRQVYFWLVPLQSSHQPEWLRTPLANIWSWKLVLVTSLVLLFAASTPAWVARVPEARLTSVDPQVILGLAALVVAILALAGGAVYFLLRNEVRSQLRSEIMGPVEVMHWLTASNACYLEYSKTWTDRGFAKTVREDPRLEMMLRHAINNARAALAAARPLNTDGAYQAYETDSVNTLAYHLATWHWMKPDEANRLEAIKHANELRSLASNEGEYLETLAWVNIACHDTGDEEYMRGQKLLEALLGREDLPYSWRSLTQSKYNNFFSIKLNVVN